MSRGYTVALTLSQVMNHCCSRSIPLMMMAGAVSLLAILGYYGIMAWKFSWVKILAGFSILFALAAVEEIVFRGVIFRIMEEWLGFHPALLISALLFGLAHLPTPGANLLSVISAVSGGIMMCLAFSLTRRLWLPVFMHAGWNFAQVLFAIVSNSKTVGVAAASGIIKCFFAPAQGFLCGSFNNAQSRPA